MNTYLFKGWLMASLFAISALFVTSCKSDKEKDATNEAKSSTKIESNLKVIPTDAFMVVEVNLKELSKKSNIIDLKDQLMDVATSQGINQKDLNEATKIFDNPIDLLGINLLKPMYMFMPASSFNTGEPSVFIAAEVKNKSKVIEMLESNTELTTQTFNEISWIYNHTDVVGAITENTLLVGTTANSNEFRDLLEQNNNFFSTEAGKFMANHSGDITVMVNMKALPKELHQEAEAELQQIEDYPEIKDLVESLLETQLVTNLTFESGKIALNLYTNGLKSDYIEQFANTIQSNDLTQIPNNNVLAVVAAGINGKKIWDAYQKIATSYLTYEERQEIEGYKKYIQALNGTMYASVGVKDFSETQPEVLCALPIAKSKGEDVIAQSGADLPNNIYIGGNNSTFTITNMPNYTYGQVSSPFAKASEAASCYAYAYVNVKLVMDQILQNMYRGGYSSERKCTDALQHALRLIDYIDLKAKKNDASLTIHLTDSSVNSLGLILQNAVTLGKIVMENLDVAENVLDNLGDAVEQTFEAAEESLEDHYHHSYTNDYYYDDEYYY